MLKETDNHIFFSPQTVVVSVINLFLEEEVDKTGLVMNTVSIRIDCHLSLENSTVVRGLIKNTNWPMF